MEKMNALTLIITLVVGVILAGSLLMPVIQDVTATEKTITNEGYFRMSEISADDESTYVLTWNVNTPNTINVNDAPVVMDLENAPNQVTVCFNGDWMLRANITNGAITTITYIPNIGVSTLASSTVEVTLNGGSATAVMDGTSKTEDYTNVYIPDADGSFVMKKSNTNAYIQSNSVMVAFGISRLDTASSFTERGIRFNGSMDDLNLSIWRPPSDTTSTITDVSVNATKDAAYVDLYELTNITMVGHYVNEDKSVTDTTLTYSYFLVPYEVTSELSQHLTPGQNSLVGAIPIMVIVALLMAAVGAIALRRAD